MAGIPSGTILPWLGSIAQIPQGWLLCDGTNGSPNLNHKYLIGTTDPNELLSTIGQPNHSHGFVGVTGTYNGAHNDNVVQNNNAPLGVPGYDHTHNFAGQTDLQPNLPPSIYVFYIFKS
jgi:hypothetical protein